MSCGLNQQPFEMFPPGEGGGTATTLSNVGGGTELVNTLSGSDYPIKTLIAGIGNTFTVGANTITINSKTLDGTATDNTQRWDGTNWVENANLKAYSNGHVRITGVTTGNSFGITQLSGADPFIITAGSTTRYLSLIDNTSGQSEYQINKGGSTYQKGNAVIDNNSGLQLAELDSNGSGTITIKSASNMASVSYTVYMPSTQGSANTYLKNDGSGNLSWETISAGTITGASNVGTGDGWWKDDSSGTLRFKSLTTDSSINVVSNADDLNLSVANPLPTGLSEETLRHNGTNWVANSLIRNNGTNIRLNGALNSTRVLTVTDSGSTCFVPVKITGTKTTALEVEITTGSLSGAKAIDIQSTNASFNGNYISVQNTTTGLKFKVDSEGAVTSDYLTSSVAHPGSFFGVFVDATTGKMYANTAGSGAAGGALPAGTGTGNVLYWNGSAWVETADFIIAGVGAELVNNHALTLRGNVSGGTAVSIYATPVGSAYNLFLPANQGTAGTVLVNDGSGNLDWKALPKNLVTEVDDNIIPSLVVGLAEVAKTYTLTGVTTANPACDASIVGLGAQAGQFTVRAEVTAVDTITVYYSYNDGLGGTIDIGDKFIHVENKIY